MNQAKSFPVRPRPKFARWMWDRHIELREAAEVLQRSHEYVRLICLPFDDPKWRPPQPDTIAKVHCWSGGEITPADWYPPELSGGAADAGASAGAGA